MFGLSSRKDYHPALAKVLGQAGAWAVAVVFSWCVQPLGSVDGPALIGELRVTPSEPQEIFFMGGMLYLPMELSYRLGNFGDREFDYELSSGAAWLKLSKAAGRLQPEGRAEVLLSIDSEASAQLQPGWHTAEVAFVNATNGKGSTTREVRFLMRSKAGLSVEPQTPAELTGASKDAPRYRLTNQTESPLEWEALPSADWIGVQPASGTLGLGESVELEVMQLADPKPSKHGTPESASVSFLNRTDGVGSTLRKLHLYPGAAQGSQLEAADPPETLSSITQYGITWTFADAVQAGRYVTGDWWVLGPVLVLDISPNSRNQASRVSNGSMINPSPRRGLAQGYDSAAYDEYKSKDSYADELNVALDVSLMRPLLLRPGASLVSTISSPQAGRRPQLDCAAILTSVEHAPARDAFRPPYVGRDKRSAFVEGQLRLELLAKLKAPPSAPNWSEVERLFERPWIDHVPLWAGRYLHPKENMSDYGREMSDAISTASLMLHLDASIETKRTLLLRFVQLGIDLHGLLLDGGSWRADGGHMSGRKWPILFAGLMLGDAQMQSIGVEYPPVTFGEDGQTFYVGDPRPELGYGEAQRGLAEWGVRHAWQPEQDDARWRHTEKLPAGAVEDKDRTHDLKYRLCCTANTWWGQVLAARIMGAQELWNHPPLFDYQDRFFEVNQQRKIFDGNLSLSKFYLQMWRRYRPSY